MQIVEKNAIHAPDAEADDSDDTEDDDLSKPNLARTPSVEHPFSMQQWCRTFAHTGGVSYLLHVFTTMDSKDVFASSLSVRCTALLLHLCNHFLSGNVNSIGVEGETVVRTLNAGRLMLRLLDVLRQSVAHPSASDDEVAMPLGSLVGNALLCISALVNADHSLLENMYAFSQWSAVLQQGLVNCRSQPVRISLAGAVKSLCNDIKPETKDTRIPRDFFLPLLLSQLNRLDTSAKSTFCAEFLQLVGELLMQAETVVASSNVEVSVLARNLTGLIQKHPCCEINETDLDHVMVNLLKLVTSLVQANPGLRNLLGANTDTGADGPVSVLESVIHDLFDLPTTSLQDNGPLPPKFKVGG